MAYVAQKVKVFIFLVSFISVALSVIFLRYELEKRLRLDHHIHSGS